MPWETKYHSYRNRVNPCSSVELQFWLRIYSTTTEQTESGMDAVETDTSSLHLTYYKCIAPIPISPISMVLHHIMMRDQV
jgi:hypothetical protein